MNTPAHKSSPLDKSEPEMYILAHSQGNYAQE